MGPTESCNPVNPPISTWINELCHIPDLMFCHQPSSKLNHAGIFIVSWNGDELMIVIHILRCLHYINFNLLFYEQYYSAMVHIYLLVC